MAEGFEMPDMSSFDLSSLELPEGVEIPSIEIPEFEVPSFEIPEGVEMPSLPEDFVMPDISVP